MKNMYDFTNMYIKYSDDSRQAYGILRDEIEKRTSKALPDSADRYVGLCLSGNGGDGYSIRLCEDGLEIIGDSPRALIYGIGLFLRKTVYGNNKITLITDISGSYLPDKSIRGHQLGYRPCSNTYDAWKIEDYKRYYLDMMMFSANMCELIPYDENGKHNELMDDCEEMLVKCTEQAKQLGLDVSLWYPNDRLSAQESAKLRRSVLSKIPELDVLFIPGSDPGDYPPDELIERVKLIAKEIKPVCKASVWVSAQAPHNSPDWGDGFISAISDEPDEIAGVIMGPNHAMPLDELRQRVPKKYPIRFYNDITHNVRCEYPVHYERDDWHFSLAAVNGRECINPRPLEFARLHRETAPYVAGSCSYSEGVNDDVNKMLWSALDFCPHTPVQEILEDYSRLFFPGEDAVSIARAILSLERNWEGDSAENTVIDGTLSLLKRLYDNSRTLQWNWRFLSLLFRAECDSLSRKRRIFDNELIEKARALADGGELEKAYEVLCTEYDGEYTALRKDIDGIADKLFDLIGIQLDIIHYHASGWERGAVLESVDLPVSDRQWLKGCVEKALTLKDGAEYAASCFRRNETGKGERYFSVALNGVSALGAKQQNEVYLNFLGDNPEKNNGSLPMCLLNIFDSQTLNAVFTGLENRPYTLLITYTDKPHREVEHHRVVLNGHVLYDGKGYGGEKAVGLLPTGFDMRSYAVAASYISGGKAELVISEPTVGFELSEIRLI